MQKKEITIYDIAEKLGVSASTVSRALNGGALTKKSTTLKICSTAELMGYRNNSFASKLRTQRSNTIGIIVPRLNSYFMSEVIAGIEKLTNEAGYDLLISQSMEDGEKQLRNIKTMFNSRVDGLLVSLSPEGKGVSNFDIFLERKIPVLFFDRVPLNQGVPTVTIDNEMGGYLVTKHLIERGARKIVHLGGNQQVSVYKERANGYKRAILENGFHFKEEDLMINDLSEQAGIAAAHMIAKKGVDGVFAANDNCAASCMNELKRLGIKIPTQVVFAGFNNDMISRNVDPPLTTINYPGFDMGRVAAAKLLDHLAGRFDMDTAPLVTIKSDLVVRGSSLAQDIFFNT